MQKTIAPNFTSITTTTTTTTTTAAVVPNNDNTENDTYSDIASEVTTPIPQPINNMIDEIEFKGILDLSGKQLKRVPRYLAECIDPIVELNLQNNQLESFIFALPQSFNLLRLLNLSHNNISTLEQNLNNTINSPMIGNSPHSSPSSPSPLAAAGPFQLSSSGSGNSSTNNSSNNLSTLYNNSSNTLNPASALTSTSSNKIINQLIENQLLENQKSNSPLASPQLSPKPSPKLTDPFQWMKHLSQLVLSNCKIKSIDELDFILFPNLQLLDLQSNQIQSISNLAFKSNLQLKHIRLCRNPQLSSLPNSISSLPNLEFLQATFCSLTTLPSEIGELTNLLVLKVSNNRIEDIPLSVGKLDKLTHIDLSHNLLRSLPLSIGYCSSITEILLSGNPLEDKVLLSNKNSSFIINYLVRKVEDHNYVQTGDQKKQIKTKEGHSLSSISYLSLNDIFSKIRINRSGSGSTKSNALKQAKMDANKQKQAALDFIKNDLKYAIDQIQSRVNDPEVALDFLLLCGDAIRSTQENFEVMSTLLKKPQFKFNSESPLPTEDKIVQLKKVINLKIEKATVYSTAIYMYLLKCKNDKEIDQIYQTIMDFHSKLTDFQ